MEEFDLKKKDNYLMGPGSTHKRVQFKKRKITWWDQTRLLEEFDLKGERLPGGTRLYS